MDDEFHKHEEEHIEEGEVPLMGGLDDAELPEEDMDAEDSDDFSEDTEEREPDTL